MVDMNMRWCKKLFDAVDKFLADIEIPDELNICITAKTLDKQTMLFGSAHVPTSVSLSNCAVRLAFKRQGMEETLCTVYAKIGGDHEVDWFLKPSYSGEVLRHPLAAILLTGLSKSGLPVLVAPHIRDEFGWHKLVSEITPRPNKIVIFVPDLSIMTRRVDLSKPFVSNYSMDSDREYVHNDCSVSYGAAGCRMCNNGDASDD